MKDVCDFHLHHVHCRSLLLITIFSAVITEFKPSTRNSARTSDTFPVSSNQFNMYDNRPFTVVYLVAKPLIWSEAEGSLL